MTSGAASRHVPSKCPAAKPTAVAASRPDSSAKTPIAMAFIGGKGT